MKTFKEFMIEAWKDGVWVSDIKPKATKGSRYSGEEYEKEESGEKEPKKPETSEPTEKRGRGRPKGAVSQDTRTNLGMAGDDLNKILHGEFQKRALDGVMRKIHGKAQSGSKDIDDEMSESIDEEVLTFKLHQKPMVKQALSGIGTSSYDSKDGHHISYQKADEPKIKDALTKAGLNPFNDSAKSSDEVHTSDFSKVAVGSSMVKRASEIKKNIARKMKRSMKEDVDTLEEMSFHTDVNKSEYEHVKTLPNKTGLIIKHTPTGKLYHVGLAGKMSLIEDVEVFDELHETKKKIGEYSQGNSTSKVYKLIGEHDEGDPYCVHLYKNGKHYEPADYFTNDEDDAHGTAKTMVKRSSMNEGIMRKVVDKLNISSPGTPYAQILKDVTKETGEGVRDVVTKPKQTAKETFDLVKKAANAVLHPVKTAEKAYDKQ